MSPQKDKSRTFAVIGGIALAVVCVVAIVVAVGGGDDGTAGDPGSGNPASELSVEEATAPAPGLPPELESLREEANQVLDGGSAAFDARLDELRGTPVVVNKWASWCGPCRFEFPFFQSQAIEREDEVAFIGLNSSDETAAAETFLSELPLPYPSYSDPDQELASSLDAGREFPSTVIVGADGEVAHTRLGGYASEEDLAADIERYAQ